MDKNIPPIKYQNEEVYKERLFSKNNSAVEFAANNIEDIFFIIEIFWLR